MAQQKARVIHMVHRRVPANPIGEALRQARERGYLDGLAEGYNQALQEHGSRRRLMGEAVLSVVAILAVILLLASRWGAF